MSLHYQEVAMPLYVIERHFAEQLEVSAEGNEGVRLVNEEIGVHWLFSFLSADRKKTFCLYEASSPEAILEAARRANLPADIITEVTELRPEAFA
jgi:hypothetical protein